ncbi:MAG: winged helix-turn-helix transcriptional regulator [Candidatus Baltobacteraceae bacterium]
MANRAYGQYCGFSRALEIVGERWALLILRDLLTGPKRFSDLQRGLRGIPSNILTARLKELEEAGVVERKAMARSAGAGVAYELTAKGRELEAPVIALGRWGATLLGEPRPGEIVTEDSMMMALRSTFRAEHAARTSARYELRLGEIVIHAIVKNRSLSVGKGPIEKPDVVIESGPAIRAIMAQEITPEAAMKNKLVRITGDRELFARFAQMFRI